MLSRNSSRLFGLTALAVMAVLAVLVTEAVADSHAGIASSKVGVGVEDADEKAALPGQFSGHAPGLIVTITGVRITRDLRPVVSFTATDERGDPVGKNELTDVRFILAYLNDPDGPGAGSTAQYISYNTRIEDPDLTPSSGDEEIQATYDLAALSGVRQRNNGAFKYKFATAIPADYDMAASHQIGGQFRRLFGADGKVYPANAIFPFRPDGGKVVERREVVDTETCNNCHTRLSLHGDIRREIQLCIMCHTPQTTDANSGNTVNFPVMVHKIHMGEELPSVLGGTPYQIVGYGNTVHDYSTVAFPPAPQDVRNCEVCHSGTAKDGSATFHLDNPTIAGCGSCHDRTWFNTALPTPVGWTEHLIDVPLTDDALCSVCHRPTEPGVKPIFEAHLLPQETEDAPGLKYEVTGYTIVTPDTTPKLQITFNAKSGDDTPITNVESNTAISLSGVIAWPVEEYTTRVQNTIQGTGESGTLVNNGGGAYTYTFASALPLGSTDTFAMALQSRRTFTHDSVSYSQGLEDNQRFIFTLGAKAPVERRAVVDEASCNVCHVEIRFHGEQRVGVDFCLMCHTSLQTDETRRDPVLGADADPESVHFKRMIHGIHRGENHEASFTLYGFGNIAHDYTEIRFPGLLNECTICHVDGTQSLPLAPEALPTVVTENGGVPVRTVLPITQACIACHDSFAAVLHTAIMSDLVGGAESCEVCHEPGVEFAVEAVHALTP